jgi:tetratricopeptide (TPR) repeat protein
MRVGNYEDAKEYLHKLVARQDDSPQEAAQARRVLSFLLAASGDQRQIKESLAMMGLVEDGLPYRPAADESIEDLRAKAQIFALRGGRQNRRSALEVLTAIINRGKPSPGDRFLLAQVLEKNGDWAKSREQMQLLLATPSESPPILAFYIRGLLQHDDGRGVKPWLEKLQKVDPSSLQTAELKARFALAEKRPDEAAKLLGDFARSKPDSTLQVALLLESLGRLDESKKLFQELATRDKQPEAGLPLAVFLGRRKLVSDALKLCDRAWETGRPELVSQASVAVLYASMPDKEVCQRVAKHMEDAIQRAPDKVALQFDLANVQILQGKYQEAEVIFRKVYDQHKENMASANNLAWLLAIQDGKASEALTLVNQAIDLFGPVPTLLDTRGVARMALGQVAPAIEDFEEATTSGPTANRYFHLAQAYQRLNRTREAKEALREATTLGLDEATLYPIERESYLQLQKDLTGR